MTAYQIECQPSVLLQLEFTTTSQETIINARQSRIRLLLEN
jgi:hypothetical protein